MYGGFNHNLTCVLRVCFHPFYFFGDGNVEKSDQMRDGEADLGRHEARKGGSLNRCDTLGRMHGLRNHSAWDISQVNHDVCLPKMPCCQEVTHVLEQIRLSWLYGRASRRGSVELRGGMVDQDGPVFPHKRVRLLKVFSLISGVFTTET